MDKPAYIRNAGYMDPENAIDTLAALA